MRRAAGLVVAALVCGAPGPARAVLPDHLAQRIEDAARSGRAAEQRAATSAARAGDPTVGRFIESRGREHALTAIDAAVVEGIATRPDLAGEIVAAASRAMPGYGAEIRARAAARFPFLAAAPQAPADVAPAAGPQVAARLPEEIDDPLEGMNRAIFRFNDILDQFLLRPIAWFYGTVTPGPVKRSMRDFFRNLRSPVRLANDLLQAEPEDAGTTLARFAINTTIGFGGMFDVAEDLGLPHRPADFGQTLYSYGAGAGPYIVIPVIGSSTLRDGTGIVVDIFFDPLTWLADTEWNLGATGGRGLVVRESLIEPLDKLRADSLDWYAAMRSLYYQDRAVDLRKGRPAPASDLDREFQRAE